MTFSFKFVSRKQDGSLLPGRSIARSVSAAVEQVYHVPQVSAHYQPNCKRLFTPAIFSVGVNFVWSKSKVQIVVVYPMKVCVAWRDIPIDSSLSTTSTKHSGWFTSVPKERTYFDEEKNKLTLPGIEPRLMRPVQSIFVYRLSSRGSLLGKRASRSTGSKERDVSCPIAFLLLLAPTHLRRYRVPGPLAKGKCGRSFKPL
jgi:hypothetical protein